MDFVAHRHRSTRGIVVALLLLLMVGASPPRTSFASCPAPALNVDPDLAAAGQEVRVDGAYFGTGCDDTAGPGERPSGLGEPAQDIQIEFEQEGRVDLLGSVDADDEYTFSLEVALPDDAQTGAATLRAVRRDDGGEPFVAATAPVTVVAQVDRLAGSGRVETAVAVSQQSHPEAAEAVVIARADDFADALAGAPFAAEVGGPLLLSGREGLSSATRAEVERLAPRTAFVLGGEAALSAQVVADLQAAGVEEVERLFGASRFETAALIGSFLDVDGPVYLALGAHPDAGRAWPDAVAVGALAARQGQPILLVTPDVLPEATRQALEEFDTDAATIIGGTGAVSAAVADAVAAEGVAVDRIAGATRFATARLVADATFADGADAGVVWLATGEAFADALAAGAAVARDGGVLLLTPTGELGADASAWFATHRASLDRVVLLGGHAALGAEVERDVRRWAIPETEGRGAFDEDAERRPDLLRVHPTTVAPGQLAQLTFPEGTERGAGFELEKDTDDGWDHRYFLTVELPRGSGNRPGWQHASDAEPVFPLVALTGPGPDVVEIPFTASAGDWRICTVDTTEPRRFCAALRIMHPVPGWTVLAADAAATPGVRVAARDADELAEAWETASASTDPPAMPQDSAVLVVSVPSSTCRSETDVLGVEADETTIVVILDEDGEFTRPCPGPAGAPRGTVFAVAVPRDAVPQDADVEVRTANR
jgi:putative cell wall-binding protein